MSGRKQHYIPQVLLRGFSASPEADSPPIVVYSRKRGVYKTNTKDTAAEREFYSPVSSDKKSLDDEITDYENELAQQLDAIRRHAQGAIEGELPSKVIAHLAIRNDHARKSMTDVGSRLMGAVGDAFSDTGTVKSMLGMDKPYSASRFKQEVRKQLKEKFPLLDRNRFARLETAMLAKLKQEFDPLYERQKPVIAAVAANIDIETITKNSHAKALSKGLAPEQRIADLARLKWILIAGDFLLPDCVAVAVQQDQMAQPYLLTSGADLHTVFMPVNQNLGMVGSVAENLAMSNDSINDMAASCSADFFVYSDRDEQMTARVGRIGSRTTELINRLTDDAVQSSKIGLAKPEP